VASLIFFIKRIIRTVRGARIGAVPLLKNQDITFAEAGRVILAIEGPLFTRRFARLTYSLRSPSGVEVMGRALLFRTASSGFTRATLQLRTYTIPTPGRYSLTIGGLEEMSAAYDGCLIVFMRPHLPQVIVSILGIIFSSWLLIGSIVFFFLRLSSGGND
jgi:hypothetical protein